MATIKGEWNDYEETISYEITDEMKDKIIEKLLQYYKENCYFGEAIHQDDNSIINAPYVLSDICDDIIKFKYKSQYDTSVEIVEKYCKKTNYVGHYIMPKIITKELSEAMDYLFQEWDYSFVFGEEKD